MTYSHKYTEGLTCEAVLIRKEKYKCKLTVPPFTEFTQNKEVFERFWRDVRDNKGLVVKFSKR
jgi:hypothetical protein